MTNDQVNKLAREIFDMMLSVTETRTKGLTGREQEVAQTKLIDSMVSAIEVDRGRHTKFPSYVATFRKMFRDHEVNSFDRAAILRLIQEWNHEHEAEYDPETLLDR